MKYRRYGSFRFGDYWGCWLGIAVFSIAIISFPFLYDVKTNPTSLLFLTVPFLCLFHFLWEVFTPHRELFFLYGDKIVSQKGHSVADISLPDQLTIVVSRADMWFPLGRRLGMSIVGKDSAILKGKFAVTLLSSPSADWVRKQIAPTLPRVYSTTYAAPKAKDSLPQLYASTVENAFPHHFLYSFVCTPELLRSLTEGKNWLVYIPASLADTFPLTPDTSVYIDPHW